MKRWMEDLGFGTAPGVLDDLIRLATTPPSSLKLQHAETRFLYQMGFTALDDHHFLTSDIVFTSNLFLELAFSWLKSQLRVNESADTTDMSMRLLFMMMSDGRTARRQFKRKDGEHRHGHQKHLGTFAKIIAWAEELFNLAKVYTPEFFEAAKCPTKKAFHDGYGNASDTNTTASLKFAEEFLARVARSSGTVETMSAGMLQCQLAWDTKLQVGLILFACAFDPHPCVLPLPRVLSSRPSHYTRVHAGRSETACTRAFDS